MKHPLGTKLYYSISEVAELTDLQPYTLRAWEKEFPCLRPKRARGKNRAYRERDIGIVLLIKQLLYQERFTTQGVKQKLKNEPDLLRQATSQAASFLEAEEAWEERGGSPAVALPNGQGTSAGNPELAADLGAGEKEASQNVRLREIIEGAKKELHELLRLL